MIVEERRDGYESSFLNVAEAVVEKGNYIN